MNHVWYVAHNADRGKRLGDGLCPNPFWSVYCARPFGRPSQHSSPLTTGVIRHRKKAFTSKTCSDRHHTHLCESRFARNGNPSPIEQRGPISAATVMAAYH